MFTPRLELPAKDNKFYIAKSEGGLNPCIPRPSGSKLRFANCVFYAVGRFAEITGVWLKSTNAENFCRAAKEMGLTVTQNPTPGCIAVWAKGEVGNSSDGAGHVAVVEIVNASGSIVTSESGWSANKEFWTTTRRNDGNWGQAKSYRFLGFIQPPTPTVRVLRKGDRGEDVRKLQTALADAGYLREKEIDGDFGVITLGAVLAFQFEHDLAVDGAVGSKTRAALGI